jgi:hypothetical protein
MTLVSDIIRDAYRESNLIAIGTEPSGAQTDEALRLINRIVSSVYGNEEGEELTAFPLGSNDISRPAGYPWYDQAPGWDWFVPPNSRLVCNLSAALTVFLSPNPDDGDRFGVQDISGNLSTYPLTVVGNGRNISGSPSVVFSTDGTNVEYMFRGDLGDWVVVTPLEGSSLWPFPDEFDDMFVIMLAMRVNPRNDTPTAPESVAALKRSTTQFKARYRQHREVGSELGLVKTLGNRYPYGYDNTQSESLFNSGYPYPWGYRW